VPDLGVRPGAGPGQEAEGGVRARTQVGRSIPAGSAAREGLNPRGVGPSSLWQGLRNARATLNADQRAFADSSLEYPD